MTGKDMTLTPLMVRDPSGTVNTHKASHACANHAGAGNIR
jgi:hypothetical protein